MSSIPVVLVRAMDERKRDKSERIVFRQSRANDGEGLRQRPGPWDAGRWVAILILSLALSGMPASDSRPRDRA
jgi:hypothetical protein